jgi:hypothetical protein
MVSDPQGADDLVQLTCNELVEGRKMNSGAVPVYFHLEPNDLGEGVDQVAWDGIYSSEGWTRDIVDQFDKAGIRIGAVDKSWNFVIADTVFEVAEIEAPGSVTLLSPESGRIDTDTALNLAWELDGDPVKYHLQVSLDESFVHIFIDEEDIRDTSHLVSGLEFNTTYYWRVRASNGYQYGTWSRPSYFTTRQDDAVSVPSVKNPDPDLPVVRPNPVYIGEDIFITLPGTSITGLAVYSVSGACIYREQQKSPVETMNISTGRFLNTEGIYFYAVTTTTGTFNGYFQVLSR